VNRRLNVGEAVPSRSLITPKATSVDDDVPISQEASLHMLDVVELAVANDLNVCPDWQVGNWLLATRVRKG
jgi:hypothetical protein